MRETADLVKLDTLYRTNDGEYRASIQTCRKSFSSERNSLRLLWIHCSHDEGAQAKFGNEKGKPEFVFDVSSLCCFVVGCHVCFVIFYDSRALYKTFI